MLLARTAYWDCECWQWWLKALCKGMYPLFFMYKHLAWLHMSWATCQAISNHSPATWQMYHHVLRLALMWCRKQRQKKKPRLYKVRGSSAKTIVTSGKQWPKLLSWAMRSMAMQITISHTFLTCRSCCTTMLQIAGNMLWGCCLR